ncbi:MAG TPA: antitoxin VbhA family protein [Candidatus Faecalibacterium faecipullorum]|uniref:Antitoxin VbhA family protein n=1 Tax=Candidatus Faecalibacterium faecipullorum TaxID=2838578 RepID=A0A9D2S6D2_9FIRM|nr:antitoxin VbhA family protein [Candidatus Faecalibacterium faecipullorum]
MKPISIERSLKNALASSAMEGFPADDAVMQDCLRLLRGETDINALIAQIKMQKREA